MNPSYTINLKILFLINIFLYLRFYNILNHNNNNYNNNKIAVIYKHIKNQISNKKIRVIRK